MQMAAWEDTLSGFVSISSDVSELSKAIESLTKIVDQQIRNLLVILQMFIKKSIFHENCASLEVLRFIRILKDVNKRFKQFSFVELVKLTNNRGSRFAISLLQLLNHIDE